MTKAAVEAGLGVVGGGLGGAAGGACGPLVVVCAPVGAAAGGITGAAIGAKINQVADSEGGIFGWRPYDWTRSWFDND